MTEKLMSKEFKDLVLELLDVIDRIRQGGLLAHLNQKGKNIAIETRQGICTPCVAG